MSLRSLLGRIRGLARKNHSISAPRTRVNLPLRPRTLQLETLENRKLLAVYNYPFGATAEDTGEYMLGDIVVNVVFMESDPSLAPYDNNPTNAPTNPGIGAPVEDWDSDPNATGNGSIAAVKEKITTGVEWWRETLGNMFPDAPENLLNFQFDWTYADNPVHTGYEPISRQSNAFGDPLYFNQALGQGWMYDFLNQVNFDATGDFEADIRAFNDSTRKLKGADWAFTIFVVNSTNDKQFADGGDYPNGFSYSSGLFMVMPSDRPDRVFGHEGGHQFWGLDEYLGGDPPNRSAGYYAGPNSNAPAVAPSIMLATDDPKMISAFDNNVLDPYTMAHLGWKDSDNDGLFDVLDVPFSLSGFGQYNSAKRTYEFIGRTRVGTLPNRNPEGTQNDITINQIGVVEYSVDGGEWQIGQTFDARTYDTPVSFDFPLDNSSPHDIQIRSRDPRMATSVNPDGVISNIFEGETTGAAIDNGIGVSGVLFIDRNVNGVYDTGDTLEPGVSLNVLGPTNQTLDLQHVVDPDSDSYPEGTSLLHPVDEPTVTLTAIGNSKGLGNVVSREFNAAAGRVFSGTNQLGPVFSWNGSRQLKAQFSSLVSTVSVMAFGSAPVSGSYGRLDAYDATNKLIARYTTGKLGPGSSEMMTITRPQGDISYVVAYGKGLTNVILDSLQWGPATSVTTNSQGAYSLDGLPDGMYRVHLFPPAGYFITTPVQGDAFINVQDGRAASSVNFGIALSNGNSPASLPYPFHNYISQYNVDNDPDDLIAPIDAMAIINYINFNRTRGPKINPADNPVFIGYIDVIPDGYAFPNDAIEIINVLNTQRRGGATLMAPPDPGDGGGSGSSGEDASPSVELVSHEEQSILALLGSPASSADELNAAAASVLILSPQPDNRTAAVDNPDAWTLALLSDLLRSKKIERALDDISLDVGTAKDRGSDPWTT